MLVSYNWLKKHVNINSNFSAEEVAAKLKSSTVEVEKVEYQGKNLEGVVVGEILEIKKHPNADKLSMAKVDTGEEKSRQIIFGQMVQLQVGLKIPVALAPTTLPGNKEIKKAVMRGEVSEGMLCLDQEMGLLKEGVSIRFFGKEVKNGTPISEVLKLDDYILEIDNKTLSHRPDLWGHYGLAREVATLFNRDLNEYQTKEIKSAIGGSAFGGEIKLEVKVEDEELCPRYMAVAVGGIKVEESPTWLKQQLLAVGLRPINNIVDITNYLMLDLGQPMHAFDAAKINGHKIIVRRAKEGEEFVALDESQQKLTSEALVIADVKRPVALAGVMGGLGSGVDSVTQTVIFESANFNPASIRKISTKLGLRTDSAIRFEKSLDPNLAALALRRAVEMTLELCPEAKVVSKVIDKKHFTLPIGPIEIALETFQQKLGVKIEEKEIIRILSKLGFEIKQKKSVLSVKIPTWRATKDISLAEDLVEEVARIYGFNQIPSALPVFPITPPEENKLRTLERKVKNILAGGLGYTEVYNYSFVSAAQVQQLGDDLSKYIELDNPLSKEKPYLRRNLLANLLENAVVNLERCGEIKIFEIGQVFTNEETGLRSRANSDDLLPRQDTWLATAYVNKTDDNPFWSARRIVENIFAALNIKWEISPLDRVLSWEHPSRLGIFSVAGTVVGSMFELHPAVAQKLGLAVRAGLVNINLDKLSDILSKNPPSADYRILPIYPEVSRDLAFVVKKSVQHADVLATLENIDRLLKKVELFDVYAGKNIGENRKSMAYHLTYGHPERTLTTEEIDKAQEKVIKTLEKRLKAEVRK